jgi:hypothetical protein
VFIKKFSGIVVKCARYVMLMCKHVENISRVVFSHFSERQMYLTCEHVESSDFINSNCIATSQGWP